MYVIVFFDDDYNIKKGIRVEEYPRVRDIVSALKHLETVNQEESFLLKMDIIPEEEFNKITTFKKENKWF